MWGSGPHSGMGWHDWGWWMGLHGFIWLLVVVGIIGGIVLLARVAGRRSEGTNRRQAIDVLDERYARGEIGRDEYLQRRRDIDSPT